MKPSRPFCPTEQAAVIFDQWRGRVEALGIELEEADLFLVGTVASRECRLQELTERLADCRDEAHRIRLVAAERAAASDMVRSLQLLAQTYGAATAEEQAKPLALATGTGTVVAFPARLSVVAQRVLHALGADPLTKAALRKKVSGSQNHFCKALQELMASGAVERVGSGGRGHAYKYRKET